MTYIERAAVAQTGATKEHQSRFVPQRQFWAIFSVRGMQDGCISGQQSK